MTPEQIRAKVQQDKVDYLLAQFVDIHGTPRCKGVPARALDLFLEGSAGFAGAAVSGMGQGPHDHDMIAMPDLGSYTLVPWETGVARFACDITVDGQAWPYCPRTALRRMTAELLREGFVMMVGAEAEHFLVRRREDGSIVPFDPDGVDTLEKPCYDFKSLAGSMGYLRTLVDIPGPPRLGALRVRPRGRDGAVRDQLEVLGRPDDRRPRHLLQDDDEPGGQDASARSRPTCRSRSGTSPGPARTSTSRSGTPPGSETCSWTSGTRGASGCPASRITSSGASSSTPPPSPPWSRPTVNDYKRLSVGEFLTGVTSGFTWTPAFISYGDNNRTQMFRVPEPGRFECRLVSGSVNPYLGMAAFVAAGLDGDPAPASIPESRTSRKNMYRLTLDDVKGEQDRADPPEPGRGRSPAFEADPVVQQALGPELAEEFIKVKRQEWVRYHNTVSRWEIDRYLTLF